MTEHEAQAEQAVAAAIFTGWIHDAHGAALLWAYATGYRRQRELAA